MDKIIVTNFIQLYGIKKFIVTTDNDGLLYQRIDDNGAKRKKHLSAKLMIPLTVEKSQQPLLSFLYLTLCLFYNKVSSTNGVTQFLTVLLLLSRFLLPCLLYDTKSLTLPYDPNAMDNLYKYYNIALKILQTYR